jgi:hypothetical protein
MRKKMIICQTAKYHPNFKSIISKQSFACLFLVQDSGKKKKIIKINNFNLLVQKYFNMHKIFNNIEIMVSLMVRRTSSETEITQNILELAQTIF